MKDALRILQLRAVSYFLFEQGPLRTTTTRGHPSPCAPMSYQVKPRIVEMTIYWAFSSFLALLWVPLGNPTLRDCSAWLFVLGFLFF